MQVLLQFVTNYKRSLRDFSFYKEILGKPFFFSLQFLYIVTFLVLFINTLLVTVTAAFYLPSLPSALNTLQSRLEVLYPEELIITIKEGTISTNLSEPLYLDVAELNSYTDYQHFITIHTKASVFDYADLDTMILVTKNTIVYPDINSSLPYRTESAHELGDTVITYQTYQDAVNRLNSFLAKLPSIAPWLLIASLILIPIMGSLVVTVWRLLILIILTGIMYPIARIFGAQYTFNQLYRMGMHALVAPITLSLILNMIGTLAPMAFTACFLLWMTIILSRLTEKKESIVE